MQIWSVIKQEKPTTKFYYLKLPPIYVKNTMFEVLDRGDFLFFWLITPVCTF